MTVSWQKAAPAVPRFPTVSRACAYCLLPYLTVGQGREAVDRVSEDRLVRGDDRALDKVFLRVVSYLNQRRELGVATIGGRREERAAAAGGGNCVPGMKYVHIPLSEERSEKNRSLTVSLSHSGENDPMAWSRSTGAMPMSPSSPRFWSGPPPSDAPIPLLSGTPAGPTQRVLVF